jgi:hypothetical protein
MSVLNDGIELQDQDEEADDIVGVDDSTEFSCALQQAYMTPGNQKRFLSDTDDTPLFSFEIEPWSLLPKTEMRPVNADYAKEVVQQSRVLHICPMPLHLNWP